MSVINQMLKDLEKRQQPMGGDGSQGMIPPTLDYQKPRSSRTKLWLWCTLSVILGSGVTYGVTQWQRSSLFAGIEADASTMANAENQADSKIELATVEQSSQREADAKLSGQIPPSGLALKIEKNTNQIALVSSAEQITEPVLERIVPPASKESKVGSDAPLAASANKLEGELRENSKLSGANLGSNKTDRAHGVERGDSAPKPASKLTQVYSVARTEQPKQQAQMKVTPVVLSAEELLAKKLQKAEVLASRGMLEQAMAVYDELIKQDPSQHGARKKLAALLYGQSRFGQAKQVLSQGQLLYPAEQEYLLLLARVHLATNNIEKAMSALAKMKDTGPEAKQKWLQISSLAQKQQDFQNAEAAFRQLAKVEPNQGRWWMGLAYALDSQADYTNAIGAYQQAMDSQNLSAKSRQFVEDRLQVLGEYQ